MQNQLNVISPSLSIIILIIYRLSIIYYYFKVWTFYIVYDSLVRMLTRFLRD